MLVRAWLFLGLISAALEMAGFFWVLHRAGWSPGEPVGKGSALHHAYQQATNRVSLPSIGLFSNPALWWGIAFELVLTAAFIYLPPLQSLLGTAALPAGDLLFVAPFPFLVWGADEFRRWLVRRRSRASL